MIPRYTHVGGTVWRDAGTPEEYVVGVCATEQDARDDVAARNAYEPRRLRIVRDDVTNPERASTSDVDSRVHAETVADQDKLRELIDALIRREPGYGEPCWYCGAEWDDRVMTHFLGCEYRAAMSYRWNQKYGAKPGQPETDYDGVTNPECVPDPPKSTDRYILSIDHSGPVDALFYYSVYDTLGGTPKLVAFGPIYDWHPAIGVRVVHLPTRRRGTIAEMPGIFVVVKFDDGTVCQYRFDVFVAELGREPQAPPRQLQAERERDLIRDNYHKALQLLMRLLLPEHMAAHYRAEDDARQFLGVDRRGHDLPKSPA